MDANERKSNKKTQGIEKWSDLSAKRFLKKNVNEKPKAKHNNCLAKKKRERECKINILRKGETQKNNGEKDSGNLEKGRQQRNREIGGRNKEKQKRYRENREERKKR